MVLGITRRRKTNRRTRARTRPVQGDNCSFKINTRIAKATGEDKRYKLGAVRVLPTRQKNKVLLQATDGQQAVCVLAAGQVNSPNLVPTRILPSRKQPSAATVELVGGQWRCSDGKCEPDQYAGDQDYPSILDVLPEVKGKPFTTKADPLSKELPHLLLGVDLALLTKVAQGLGTSKLSFLIPVPVHTTNGKAGTNYVNKPVLVCPATDDDKSRGIGVLMPLRPTNGSEYYMKTRQAVVDAENRLKPKSPRQR